MTTEDLWVILMIALATLIYLGSLWINPWVKCSRCGGRVTEKGVLFTYAFHACPRCKGTGRQVRFGRRYIFGPPPGA